MHYTRHDHRLAARVSLLYPQADAQLARELLELHEKKCTLCQSDRLGCSMRPACKDRNFLNMLIELGVAAEDLPDYCYSQYLQFIKQFILQRIGTSMDNRRVFINDLLSTLGMSSIRQFVNSLSKRCRRYAKVDADDALLVICDELLFHFDFARGIVLMNPFDLQIRSYETFRQYVTLMSKYYEVESTSSDITVNWWAARIRVENVTPTILTGQLDHELVEQFEVIEVENSDGGVTIVVEAIVTDNHPFIKVRDLQNLFSAISKVLRPQKSGQ